VLPVLAGHTAPRPCALPCALPALCHGVPARQGVAFGGHAPWCVPLCCTLLGRQGTRCPWHAFGGHRAAQLGRAWPLVDACPAACVYVRVYRAVCTHVRRGPCVATRSQSVPARCVRFASLARDVRFARSALYGAHCGERHHRL